MHTHRYTFFASIFTLLFIVTSVTRAQITTTSNGNSASARGATVVPGTGTVNNDEPAQGAWNKQDWAAKEDWSSLDVESSQFMQNHPRIAKAMKFLNNDSYRAGIEANLHVSSA